MDHEVYLQGSYANHTNIAHDSDVDIVVETSNSFFSDVPESLMPRPPYEFTKADYTLENFRAEVIRALQDRYGRSVGIGDKSIKVPKSTVRLDADVVPCSTYRKYDGKDDYDPGIRFRTKSGVWIVNFPKLHRKNGESKNSDCYGRYKPAVRMFKNARSASGSEFPSYFLECLLYNVPAGHFVSGHSLTYVNALSFLESADIASFWCQNQQQKMIGRSPWQIDLERVQGVIRDLRRLWNLGR